MVFISSPGTSATFSRDQPKMSAKQLILLTPEFFTPDFMSQSQFADVSAKKVKCIEANERSPLLAPPTPEGLALLSSSVSRAKSGGLITPDSLAVVPFVQPVDHSLEQLLPFRQSLAPYGNIPRTSSYLSISHSQIPLGIFWDIENIRPPKNKSPAAVIEAIRQKFLIHYREAEFLVVCDAFKERKSLLMDINSAQVTVVHVPCTSKNAADDKLRQCMRRFIDNAGTPCAVMLISSDVNFSVDLSDFKNRKKIHVILLHGHLASEALILSSNEHYLFDDLVDHVTTTPQFKATPKTSVYLEVTNLPSNVAEAPVRQRLEQIAENCGGKVAELRKNRGVIRFSSASAAERALLRMNGEDVFGRKIVIQRIGESNLPKFGDSRRSNFPPPPNPAKVAPPLLALPIKTSPGHNAATGFHWPFLSSVKENERVSRNFSESSEDEHHRRNFSSDDVSPLHSSDYDEENERPEKDTDTKKLCDDFIRNRSRVKTLVSNIPHKSLPLNLFSQLFKLSFNCTITRDELERMNDVVLVTENGRGPFLHFRKTNTHQKPVEQHVNKQESSSHITGVVPRPRCPVHDKSSETVNGELLFVFSALSELNLNVVKLLQFHGGIIPLASLPQCYASEFGPLNVDNERGMPFEQLLGFMKNVNIVPAHHFKLVQLKTNDHEEKDPKSTWNPLLMTQLNILSNEIVDLLKAAPSNRIPFNNFNASYFDHFSRHCKVSDYGYTRLVDLLETMPNVVQVLGEGSHRYLTLSRHVQVNRFRSDVSKVLKHQPNRRVSLKLFEETFEKAIGKQFKPQDYGLCLLEDLLDRLIESKSIVIFDVNEEKNICFSMKDLTEEQSVRVKQFAVEAFKLLKASPKYTMKFSKFIPAYHVQYGEQCKLANYGCTKLVDLFEHISHIVEVKDIENSTEKLVRLKLALRLKILGEQLAELIKKRPDGLSVVVDTLPDGFRLSYGFSLDPRDFDCENIYDVMTKLDDFVQVVRSDLGDELRLSSRYLASVEQMRVFKMLCLVKDGAMVLDELLEKYKSCYFHDCQLDFSATDSTKDLFVIEENETRIIKLSRAGELSRMLVVLITGKGGRIALNELQKQFFERYGCRLTPAEYGHDNLASLLTPLSQIVTIRGKGAKKGLYVSQHIIDVLNAENVNAGKRMQKKGIKEESLSVSAKSTVNAKQKQLKSRIAAVFQPPPPNCCQV